MTLHELADKFKAAGFANAEITEDDLRVLGIPPLKKYSGWEGFCSYIYKELTGNEHPGSNAMGRGFRSQQYGQIVAEAIRKKADEEMRS